MAKFYKYVDEGEITEETIQMSQETGAFNASYHQDEKWSIVVKLRVRFTLYDFCVSSTCE